MDPTHTGAIQRGPGTLIGRTLLFITPFLFYLAAVVAIDPRGEFGTKWLAPSINNARVSKRALFDERAKVAPVDGLILGSSRSMYLPPSVFEQRQHMRYFNFAVNNGNIEDDFAVFRWVKQRDPALRSVIIGIEGYSLFDTPSEPDFLRSRPLIAAYVGAPPGALKVPGRIAQWMALLEAVYSLPYAKAAAYGLALRVVPGRVPPATREDSDGVLREVKLERAIAQRRYSLAEQMRSSIAFNISVFSHAGEFSQQRRADLESLVREARAAGVDVSIWITSMHPAIIARLREATRYSTMMAQTRTTLDDLVSRYGIQVRDFSTPDKFGGRDDGFYDGYHVDPSNAALIADRLAKTP